MWGKMKENLLKLEKTQKMKILNILLQGISFPLKMFQMFLNRTLTFEKYQFLQHEIFSPIFLEDMQIANPKSAGSENGSN